MTHADFCVSMSSLDLHVNVRYLCPYWNSNDKVEIPFYTWSACIRSGPTLVGRRSNQRGPIRCLPDFLLILESFPAAARQRQPPSLHSTSPSILKPLTPNSARQRRLTKYTMGFWDTIADLAESVAPWSVAEAEAPAAEDSKVRQ